MSQLQYQKYGATVTDPSANIQAGLNAQKTNLTEILGSINGLMKNQETRYQEENTLNVQNYFKDKLQAGGLNTALTEPINQEELKQKYGNMIDLGAVNSTVSAQTDLLKKRAVEFAATAANQDLTKEGGRNPLNAALTFKNTILANGGTNSFADEQLPVYMANKATEVQNIAIAKTQEHETRVSHVLNKAAEVDPNTKKSGGHAAGMLAIEASILDLPENEQAKARESLRAELEKAGLLTQYQTEVMKSYNDAYSVEATRRVNEAKNVSIKLKERLNETINNGVQDRYIKAVAVSGGITDDKGNLSQSIVNQLGNVINNPIEKWAGAFSESGKLRAIREGLIGKVPGDQADAMLLQAFQDAYEGNGFFGNDLNAIGINKIKARIATLTENYQNKIALSNAVTEADMNISNVEAKALQDGITLRKNMFAAGRDEQLSRGRSVRDPLTSESIDATAETFMKNMGFGKPTAGGAPATKEKPDATTPKIPFTAAEVEAEKKRIAALKGNGSDPTAPAEKGKANLKAAVKAPTDMPPVSEWPLVKGVQSILKGGPQKWADSLNADSVAKMSAKLEHPAITNLRFAAAEEQGKIENAQPLTAVAIAELNGYGTPTDTPITNNFMRSMTKEQIKAINKDRNQVVNRNKKKPATKKAK